MSDHFKNLEAAEFRSASQYYLKRSSCASTEHYIRRYTRIHVGFFAVCWFYFMYCNPEFFADYRWVRSKLGLDYGEAWFPKYFKVEYRSVSRSDNTTENNFAKLEKEVALFKLSHQLLLMCILAFVTNYSSRLPFVLISNRDEFLNRQTLPLSWKHFSNVVLCAFDVKAGGTWMGLERKHGRFAIITNCRRPASAALTLSSHKLFKERCYLHFNNKITASTKLQKCLTKEELSNHKLQRICDYCSSANRFCIDSRAWRGAAPLLEILKNTKVKTFINEAEGNKLERTLSYEPMTSRGTIVKDYLLHGLLPSAVRLAEEEQWGQPSEKEFVENKKDKLWKQMINEELLALPSPSLYPPYYAGYNLLTCPSLFGNSYESLCECTCTDAERNGTPTCSTEFSEERILGNGYYENSNSDYESTDNISDKASSQSPFALHYTTNRYAVQYNQVESDNTIHCLQNSYIDNWAEPKCAELRRLFKESLENGVTPFLNVADAQCAHSLCDETILTMASRLADTCLNATPEFNLREMINNDNTSQTRRDELRNVLHSNDPLSGFTAAELIKWWGEGAPFTNGNASEIENELQRNIFTREQMGYATRVQSVVFVERLQESSENYHKKSDPCERTYEHLAQQGVIAEQSKEVPKEDNSVFLVHFMQRATPAENAQDTSWKHFKLRSDE